MKRKDEDTKDIDICLRKIEAILSEYNCVMCSQDDYCNALLMDSDTNETRGFGRN